jgi:putative membrane-bound dehydrogenase-like protein
MISAMSKLPILVFVSVLLVTLSTASAAGKLSIKENKDGLVILRDGKPILTQVAKENFRPYLHPIVAPDGKDELTEFSPGHHKHQTGLYWGFTRVNKRDHFHHPGDNYFERASVRAGAEGKDWVSWQVVYDLLDAKGKPVLTEAKEWKLRDNGDHYVLDLIWSGTGQTDVTIGKYSYGGLFLRMPWKRGIPGMAINSNGEKNGKAEGKRANWVDVGMQVKGRDDLAHMVMMDHPDNPGYPTPWRVDGQLGVGPCYARLGDWKIAKGKKVSFQHRLLIYTGDSNKKLIKSAWEDHIKGAKNKVAKHDDDDHHDHHEHEHNTPETVQVAVRAPKTNVKYLTPQQAVDKMTLPDDFEVKVFAGEPDIGQPIAFCYDARGRIWVVENFNYRTRRQHTTDQSTKLAILEDTDGDGKFDKKKYFTEKLKFSSGIAVGHGGVWVGSPPNLLFIPDADGDDKPDSAPKVLLEGWGINDRHETLNSFLWGPDGWLYGCHGVFTKSNVGKPGAEKDTRQYIDGGIWRYHPTRHEFEVFAHGLSNPWGMDFDKHGQMFATACVIPHLWHVIQGGYYHRQAGQHQNRFVYDNIKTIRDHQHKSAHGGARFYQADTFGAKYRDRLFMCNIHQHQVLTDIMVPKGSGFVGKHGDDFLSAHDRQWVGFSVEIGPDGAVYILDWHDNDICGKIVAHGDTGRIYRIARKGAKAITPPNLPSLSDEKLVEMQLHSNDWYVRHARVLLAHRAATGKLGKGVELALKEMFMNQADSPKRLRALWALHSIGATDESMLLSLMNLDDPHVRGWAVQLLCETKKPSDTVIAKLAKMAASEKSPVVRLYLASALGRMPHAGRWDVVAGLVKHEEDADDHNLPKMIWYGFEPIVKSDVKKALSIAVTGKLPLVRTHVARRIADTGKTVPKTNRRGKGNSTDAKALTATLQQVAPGFSIAAVGEGGVRSHSVFRNRKAVQTHPIKRGEACVLTRELTVPAGKKTMLMISVSHHPHGDFQLVVRADGKALVDQPINSKTVTNEWADLKIDLSKYAGKKIKLAIENKPSDWQNEWAYWNRVLVVSE